MAEPRGKSNLPFAAFRHRDFRLFWIGVVLSGFGSQFTSLAMSWQIYEITGSALQLGLLGLVRAVPTMVVLLFGGLLADAVDRRRLMMVTQAGQLCVTGAVLLLSFTGAVTPAAFYVASAFLALFNGLENPARQAFVVNLVPAADLTNALALNSVQRNVAMIAGPSLAGITLAIIGPWANYAVDTASWLAMIVALLVIHPTFQAVAGRRALSFQALGEGFTYVWTHPILMAMMALDFVANVFGSARGLLPIYAMDILKVGPQGLGLLSAVSSAASIGAAAAMSVFSNVRRPGVGVLLGVAFYSVCTALFAVSQVFWFSVVMLAGQGIGNTVSTVLRGTILQLNIPDELRGRVSAVNQVFTNGGPQLSQFRGGGMAEWMGAEGSALFGALVTLGFVGVIAAVVPMVRQFEIVGSGELSRTPART